MPNLSDIVSEAFDTLLAVEGQAVTYARGASTVQLQAVLSYRRGSSEPDNAVVEHWESWDFFVRASAILIGGGAVLPAIGDQITDATGHVYQVSPIPGGKHFDYRDAQRQLLRVHTTFVS